jgi:cell shape-determining protein MreC
VVRIIAPAESTLRSMVAWVRGRTRTGTEGRTPEIAALEQQVDQYRFRFLQAEAQLTELRAHIAEISRSVELNPGQNVRLVTAPVIGGASDLTSKALTVRAGRAQQVERGAVAVVHGVHLVGPVVSADDRTCTVLPITDRAQAARSKGQGYIDCVIMLDADRRGPNCQLKPDGKGRLVGPVASDALHRDPTTGESPAIKPGMVVRLDDLRGDWPASAQMLVVGLVTAIEPQPNQPLRQFVTVEPQYDIERPSEVTIRSLIVEDAPKPSAKPEGATP